MQKKAFLTTAFMATSAMLLAIAPSMAQDKVTIDWFVGLGTGTNEQQIAAQDQVVADFKASHPNIELVITLAASNTAATDTLSTLIASGNAPDIVGPVGYAGSNAFADQWMDLTSLVEETGFDLSQYPEELVALYQTEDGLTGLPFAVFPSFIYYNADLFDEAGLEYPPSEYGAPYIDAEGNEVEWNWDTVAELAKTLTVDANGNDATSADFDPAAIEQFGFIHQWAATRSEWSSFGGAPLWDAETQTVSVPENWREQAQWSFDRLWVDHTIPNSTYDASALLNGNAFNTGSVAMARSFLWYTCCLGDLDANFNVAPLPAYNGSYFATVDADTFRMVKTTEHPQEAFEVLTYLQGEASLDLLAVYGGLPARSSDRDTYFTGLDERYPGLNRAVIEESLTYAVSPHHEANFPNFAEGFARLNEFRTLLYSDSGATMDVNAELDKLEVELQAILTRDPSEAAPAEATAEGS